MTEYIKHENQKWDFSKTRNKDVALARFILEYLTWNPVYQHFTAIKKKGLLYDDIQNFESRHKGKKSKKSDADISEDQFLEVWGDI